MVKCKNQAKDEERSDEDLGILSEPSEQSPVRVYHWYYRSKGREPITLPPLPWVILWSCRAPWNDERCGHITRLRVTHCGLTSLDVRELNRLAHLSCAGNLLERLDCSGMSQLQSLDCSGNDLAHVNVEGCVRLQRLRTDGNRPFRQTASELLALARGEPRVIRRPRPRLTATSLFDL